MPKEIKTSKDLEKDLESFTKKDLIYLITKIIFPTIHKESWNYLLAKFKNRKSLYEMEEKRKKQEKASLDHQKALQEYCGYKQELIEAYGDGKSVKLHDLPSECVSKLLALSNEELRLREIYFKSLKE